VEREEFFKSIIGNKNLHKTSNGKSITIANFATTKEIS
jgi:hypothetical protein